MEHIEEAGIHSGDTACSLPPYALTPATIAEIERQTVALARALDVVGLMNVQFAVKDGDDLRARGQSARLAHRAVRRQGDRRADRQDRRAGDGRRARSPTSPRRAAGARRPCRGQGGGVPVRPLPGRRPDPRAGDAIDRRGHGARRRFRPRLRQVAARRRHRDCRSRAASSSRCATATRRRWSSRAASWSRWGFALVATRGTGEKLRAGGPAGRRRSTRCGRPARISSTKC